MKKILFVLLSAAILFGGVATAKVSAAEPSGPYLQEHYELSVDEDGVVTLPEVQNAGETQYSVTVYRAADDELRSPLYENVRGSFQTKYTGEVLLVYTPDGEGETLRTEATVSDSVLPVLEITGLEEVYYKDDVTSFSVNYSDNVDDADDLIYVLRVWYEGVPYTAAIQDDGQVRFDIKGNYSLIFTVRDSSGNTAEAEYPFSVGVNGFDFSNLIPVLAVAIMLAMFFLPIVIVVKSEFSSRKEKKKK